MAVHATLQRLNHGVPLQRLQQQRLNHGVTYGSADESYVTPWFIG